MWSDLQARLDGHGNPARGGGSDIDLDVSFDADCPQDGRVDFDGTWRYQSAVADGWAVVSTFDYDLGFDSCTKHDRALDGDVAWDSTFLAEHADGEGGASYEYHWQGDLVVSGDMEGTCSFDVVGRVAATYTTVSGTFDAEQEKVYEGTLCGHDVSKLSLHIEID